MSGIEARPRILVVRTDSTAGLVCTLPLLRALREAHPAAWLEVLTRAELAPLLARHPDVSGTLAYAGGKAGGLLATVRLAMQLRARRLDDVVLADPTAPRQVLALARRSGAARVVGAEAPDRAARSHESQRVLALGASFGVQPRAGAVRLLPDSGEVMHVRAGLAARSRDLQRPIVGVYVGDAADLQRWPAERFAALMRRRYEHDGSGFLLLWQRRAGANDASAEDELVAREIHTRLVGVPCLRWPVATLPALAAALAECDVVIAPMTDVPMLAAALGRPVVALCGGADVNRWRPTGVPHELARAPDGTLASLTVDQAFAACEVLATRLSLLPAG